MVKGQNLQTRYCLPLFNNFSQFNTKTTPAYHCIIQKDMDELLAKGSDKLYTGDAGFDSQHICCSQTYGLHMSHTQT